MIFKTGTILGKSRTASLQTLPSPSLCEDQGCIAKLTRVRYSLATGADNVRGKLVEHANELLSLGTDGFRIDAAKRTSHSTVVPVVLGLTRATLSDIPVEDLQAIFSRLTKQPSYVTQEV